MSVCLVPLPTIRMALDMLWKVKSSESKKARISMLEFTQVFMFNNFAVVCNQQDIVNSVEELIISMLADEALPVRC